MKYVILFITALSVTNISIGQKNREAKSLNVTGTVSTSSGQPISSVSVNVKGRTNGHSADKNGNFSIKDVRDGDSLLFTCIAYKTVLIKVKGNNIVNVTMEQNVRSCSPLLVIDSAVKKETQAAAADQSRKKDMNMIFEKVEIEAYYNGGEKALLKYLGSVIKYPESAKEKHIQGEVLVGFIVGVKGEVKNVRIIRGISAECDEEALKAIQSMPDWVCAIQNGRAIEEYIEMPITFRLIDKN